MNNAADYLYLGENSPGFDLPVSTRPIFDYEYWRQLPNKGRSLPLLNKKQYLDGKNPEILFKFVRLSLPELDDFVLEKLTDDKYAVIILTTDNAHGLAEQRRFFFKLIEEDIQNPLLFKETTPALPPNSF